MVLLRRCINEDKSSKTVDLCMSSLKAPKEEAVSGTSGSLFQIGISICLAVWDQETQAVSACFSVR